MVTAQILESMVEQEFYSMSRNETLRRLQERADCGAENIIQELGTKHRGYLRWVFASVLSVGRVRERPGMEQALISIENL